MVRQPCSAARSAGQDGDRDRERDEARPSPLNTMARLWTQPQVPVSYFSLGSVGSDPVSASNVSLTLGSDRLAWF